MNDLHYVVAGFRLRVKLRRTEAAYWRRLVIRPLTVKPTADATPAKTALALTLTMLVATGCETPTKPTTLAVNCPISRSAQSPDGLPVTVSYPAPTVSGGDAATTVTCTPGAGSPFQVGFTLVTCSARNARQSVSSCSFDVQVLFVPPPVRRLSATKFTAFGDSITEGASASCARVTPFMTFAETMLVLPKASGDPWTYPNVLQTRLRSTYPAQSPTVSNRGFGGEVLATGASRLPDVLSLDQPEVLLLQEGANDVNQGRSPASIATSLRSMVREARSRGVQVYVGTLLPQRPIGVQGSCRGFAADGIVPANDQIRIMAASEGAPLIDLYQVFGAVPGDLIGQDGLHPSEAGYQKIADTFFDAIKQRLEN